MSLATANYSWKGVIKLLLSAGSDAIDSQLQSQLFYSDDADLDDVKPYGGTNGGIIARYHWTKESKTFEVEGPIYEDVFNMDKYLFNGVDVNLKFVRNRSSFLMMSDEASPAYKL